ncbi:MAG: Crp/Fnr family transcriptional regulator [Saprospiraceae bacterium]|nr:Crp/Fnr family transcriptional regulator [Saprospiraceae bacterium]
MGHPENIPLCADCASCKSRIKSVFSQLNGRELASLNTSKSCQTYKKGEHIFLGGNYPKGLYCVQSGKIKVTQEGADGKEQILHLIGNGNIMGHRAILSEDVFSCTATAMEPSKVCFIPKQTLDALMESNGRLTLRIARLLAEELKEAELKITHTAQHPVKDRLAKSILQLQDQYGTVAGAINVNIRREDLASLAGTARETATRFEMHEKNILKIEGRKIAIIDMDKLQAMAGGLS